MEDSVGEISGRRRDVREPINGKMKTDQNFKEQD
jgi:hypothetical protein